MTRNKQAAGLVLLACILIPLSLWAQDADIYINTGDKGDQVLVTAGGHQDSVTFTAVQKETRDDIRIVKYGSRSPDPVLAMGDLFYVELTDQDRSGPDEKEIHISIGDRQFTLTAQRVIQKPDTFKTPLMEVIRSSQPDWDMAEATFKDNNVKLAFDGITMDAYMDLINDLIDQAVLSKDVILSFTLANQIAQMVLATKEAALIDHAGLAFGERAGQSIIPEYLKEIGKYLLRINDEFYNQQVTTKLERLAKRLSGHKKWNPLEGAGDLVKKGTNPQEIYGPIVKMAMVLMREGLVASCLHRLTDINKLKNGQGFIPGKSFLRDSIGDAVDTIREMSPNQMDRYLALDGIRMTPAQRDKLRQAIIDRSVRYHDTFEDVYYRMSRALDAYNAYDYYHIEFFDQKFFQDFGAGVLRQDWMIKKKKEAVSDINRYGREYEGSLSNPLLKVFVDAGDLGEVPLWKALAKTASPQLQNQYIDAALEKTEQSIKSLLKKMVPAKEVHELLELGGPRYGYLQDALLRSARAPRVKDLVDVARHAYGSDQALWQKYQIAIEAGMAALQTIGSLFPVTEIAAAGINIAYEGGKYYLDYSSHQETQAAVHAGFAGTGDLVLAQNNLNKSFNGFMLEMLVSLGEAGNAALDWRKETGLDLDAKTAADAAIYEKANRRLKGLENFQTYHLKIEDFKRQIDYNRFEIDRTQKKIHEIEKEIGFFTEQGRHGVAQNKKQQLDSTQAMLSRQLDNQEAIAIDMRYTERLRLSIEDHLASDTRLKAIDHYEGLIAKADIHIARYRIKISKTRMQIREMEKLNQDIAVAEARAQIAEFEESIALLNKIKLAQMEYLNRVKIKGPVSNTLLAAFKKPLKSPVRGMDLSTRAPRPLENVAKNIQGRVQVLPFAAHMTSGKKASRLAKMGEVVQSKQYGAALVWGVGQNFEFWLLKQNNGINQIIIDYAKKRAYVFSEELTLANDLQKAYDLRLHPIEKDTVQGVVEEIILSAVNPDLTVYMPEKGKQYDTMVGTRNWPKPFPKLAD